jgi:hypothetical protein
VLVPTWDYACGLCRLTTNALTTLKLDSCSAYTSERSFSADHLVMIVHKVEIFVGGMPA